MLETVLSQLERIPLCDYVKKEKLNYFTVSMLTEIYTFFKLPFKSRDPKAVLMSKIKEMTDEYQCSVEGILVARGRAPFGQYQESRPLASSNNGSPQFTDFPLLCACSESSLRNLTGSGLNLLCLQSHSKPECCWTGLEVAIFGADQKERGLWGRE